MAVVPSPRINLMKTFSCRFHLALPIAATVFLAACTTTPRVNNETKPGTDFSRYKTFTILPFPTSGPSSDPGLIVRVGGPARQALTDAMVSKGFTEASAGQADLAVHLHGQSVPKVDVTQLGYSRSVMTRGGTVNVVTNPDLMVNEYEQRTLAIEMLDTRTKETVWTGWMTRKSSKPPQVQNITNAIHQILTTLPK